jgi:hypothetical protein
MATVVFRCPMLGVHVQGWFADDGSENGGEVYDTLTCAACRQVHLVNRASGRVLGAADDE